MQILREIFKEPKDVFVKAKQKLWTPQFPHSMSREDCQLILINPTQHTGIISKIIYITVLQNKPKVALHNLKGFSGLFLLRFIPKFVKCRFRPLLRDVNFTINLAKAREFIGRFYHLFQGYSNKNLHFPHKKLPKIIFDKTTAKNRSFSYWLFGSSSKLSSRVLCAHWKLNWSKYT